MSLVRDVLRLLVWLAPASGAKNAVLRLLGHEVAPGVHARTCLVWRVQRLRMAPGSRIGRLNVLKHLRSVELGAHASIGRMNLVSAHPVFARLDPAGACLVLGPHAKITSRHQLDCSARVSVGAFAAVAGHRTTILTHAVDLRRDAQVARPVVIGERSFVGTNCLLLGGAVLPVRSVLGAGAVLTRAGDDRRPGLWAGVPARYVQGIEGAWFDRSATHTRRVHLPATGLTVEQAF